VIVYGSLWDYVVPVMFVSSNTHTLRTSRMFAFTEQFQLQLKTSSSNINYTLFSTPQCRSTNSKDTYYLTVPLTFTFFYWHHVMLMELCVDSDSDKSDIHIKLQITDFTCRHATIISPPNVLVHSCWGTLHLLSVCHVWVALYRSMQSHCHRQNLYLIPPFMPN